MTKETLLTPRCNWAGNYQYKAQNLYRPQNVAEIQELVTKLDKIKALGSRHCFNDIADSPSAQISTENLNRIVSLDENAMTATIESGLQYGQFCPELDSRGYALHNLASLPHINIVGACATATHGSGITNGNLATAVVGLEFVSGTGELITLTRENDREKLKGAVVNLGGLGVVTKVSLDIERSYSVRQDIFQNLFFGEIKNYFSEIMSSGYSVSLFTGWQGIIDQIWVKRRVESGTGDLPDELFGARAATEDTHPIEGVLAENSTQQLGVPGAWFERLPHFKMDFMPSKGAELQSEYFVPAEHAVEAITALDKIRDQISTNLIVSEIRAIAADDLWLSPCYKRDSVAIHFTWKPDPKAVGNLLPVIERQLEPFVARPHWGKLFAASPAALRDHYEKIPDFVELLNSYDPKGKFRNNFLDKYLFDTV